MKIATVAAVALMLPMLALAGESTYPGSAGQPVSENQPDHLYQCVSDGFTIRANAAAGYGRCRAVFPLAVPGISGVVQVRAVHGSADKSASITMDVQKMLGGGSQHLKFVTSPANAPSYYTYLTAEIDEPLLPGESLFAIVELRGDTVLHQVRFETIEN